MSTKTIVQFRGTDLRISDHAPFRDALAAGAIIALFGLALISSRLAALANCVPRWLRGGS